MTKILLICFFWFSSLTAELLILHNSTSERPNKDSMIEVEKLQKIASKYNITVKFKGYPWKRSLMMIEKGLADGCINASYKEDRATYAMYPMVGGKLDSSRRLNDGNAYYIYKNRKSTLQWDGKKFTKVDGPIGVKVGYAVIEDLKKHKNVEIKIRAREEHLLADLSKRKIAAIATGESLLNFKDRLKNFDLIVKKEPIAIRKKDYFLIFSKKTYAKKYKDIQQLWNGLKE